MARLPKMRKKGIFAARLATDLIRSPELRAQRMKELYWSASRRYATALEIERDGRRYLVNPSDIGISRGLFFEGNYEGENIDAVYKELRCRDRLPDQIFDVGANIGFVTVDLLGRIPDATGVAFEPDALNYRLLRQNLVGNDLDHRVVTHHMAVSDADTELEFELSGDNAGDHRVRVMAAGGLLGEDNREITTVPARRLDTLLAEGTIEYSARTLVWMDIQGHEAQAIEGFGKFADNPTVVEMWPYVLRRAGQLERFIELVTNWDEIIEVGRIRQQLTLDGLCRRVIELGDTGHGYTDLLLLKT